MSDYEYESCVPMSASSDILGYDDVINGSLAAAYGERPNDSVIFSYGNGSNFNASLGSDSDVTQPDDAFHPVSKVLSILNTMVCIFGLLGNILTMLILTRKRLKMSCDGTERTVHIGLTALAVSDFMFCLTLLPYGFLKRNIFSYSSLSFQLVYEIYMKAFINTFLLTSTWLTVTIATGRYLAICHPFRARHVIGMNGTKATMFLVFITCAVFNIPRLFTDQIDIVKCHDGRKAYFKSPGYMKVNVRTYTIYTWIYFIVGITLPLCLLAFCNFCLVRVLRESANMRRRSRVPAAHIDANYRVTSILVTIVVMYITFVSPAEILLFVQDRLSSAHNHSPALVITVDVTNLLQMINFSCNFILYFVLNVHFRKAMRDMFCSWPSASRRRTGSDLVGNIHKYQANTMKSNF